MNPTNSKSFDVAVLRNRVLVTDQELAFMLGVGVATARKIANSAGATFREGNRKMNVVEKVVDYVNTGGQVED